MKLNKSDNFRNFEGKEQIQMGLDLENTHSIMSLLRNNIYSDPITSWVREIYSNAVDAHARINNTGDAIDIDIFAENGGYSFVVRDYGPSMDKETIANVYAKMGKSDKRSGNNEMGGWGLGAKSPLAYTDHFWIETFTIEQDAKVYRKWVQYIDPSRVGALSLLEEKEWPLTNSKTGTKVTIPFDNKDYNAVTEALQYYLSYTDANYNLLGDLSSHLTIGRKWYTHYGEEWAIDLKDPNSSYWVSEVNDGIAIVGDIPYKIDCKTLFGYFRNNLEELIPIIHNMKPKYIKDDKRNRALFTGFLNSLLYHKFEIKLGIGTVDLSASREDLQYTDRTCGYLFRRFYNMFLEVYQFIRMDLVNHPNYPEACITYNTKYEGGFKTQFLKNVRWAKEDLAFGANPPIFKTPISKDYCTYNLDTIYTKNNRTKDVLKRGACKTIITGVNRYEIVIQDTEYSNFSKFVKYYAQLKTEDKYSYEYLCIHPNDLETVYDWILESTTTVKLSELVSDFKINAPATAGNRAASGSFKALTYRYHNERPRAEGISSYFDYDEIPINPDEERYYISKDQWKELPQHLEGMSDGYYYSSNVNKSIDCYLHAKGIKRRHLVYTNKVTRNFKDDNWINFIDLLEDDYNKFKSKTKQVALAIFTATIVERQMPEFIKLDSTKISNFKSQYLSLKKFYDYQLEYLNNNKEAIAFLALVNSSIRELQRSREGSYCNYTLGKLDFLGEYEEEGSNILEMYTDYLSKLPFLKLFGDYRIEVYDIYSNDFIEYINVIEEKYNYYVEETKEEPLDFSQEVSEFKLLHSKLSKRYLLEN